MKQEFQKEMKMIGKRDGVNPGNVLRNYYLGPAASVLSQVLKEHEDSKDHVFIGAVAGASLRDNPTENWQRSTNDVDLQKVNMRQDVFSKAMIDLAIELRDLIKNSKGNNIFEGSDITVTNVSVGPSVAFPDSNMLRGKLNIPRVKGLQEVKLSVEASSYNEGVFEDPLMVKPSHPYLDKNELNLSEIPVVTLNNYIANKVVAFLSRLRYVEAGARASRIKDLFDIWFLIAYSGLKIGDISLMVNSLLERQYPKGFEQIKGIAQNILANPENFFNEFAQELKDDIPSASKLPVDNVLKHFTSGMNANFKYPSNLELAQSFALALESSGFKK